jgi:isopenicillin N synthase-like dioxygenase
MDRLSFTVPTVDLGAFAAGGRAADKLAAAEQIARAASTVGVFHVLNHGLPAATRAESIAASKEFFAQPDEAKQSVAAQSAAAGFVRGYIGFGGESGSDRREVKEAFSLGYEWPPGAPVRTLPSHFRFQAAVFSC